MFLVFPCSTGPCTTIINRGSPFTRRRESGTPDLFKERSARPSRSSSLSLETVLGGLKSVITWQGSDGFTHVGEAVEHTEQQIARLHMASARNVQHTEWSVLYVVSARPVVLFRHTDPAVDIPIGRLKSTPSGIKDLNLFLSTHELDITNTDEDVDEKDEDDDDDDAPVPILKHAKTILAQNVDSSPFVFNKKFDKKTMGWHTPNKAEKRFYNSKDGFMFELVKEMADAGLNTDPVLAILRERNRSHDSQRTPFCAGASARLGCV